MSDSNTVSEMFFQRTVQIVDEYFWKHKTSTTSEFDPHLVNELRVRLRQLSYLYSTIIDEQDRILSKLDEKLGPRPPDENRVVVITNIVNPPKPNNSGEYIESTRMFTAEDELRLHLENFYYLSHRVRTLLQTSGGKLPGLQSFEVLGVARVRNNLLEHPNKKDGITVMSFSVSNAAGARLKPVNQQSAPNGYVDEGFFYNAKEFRSNLEILLRDSIADGF